MSTVAFLRAVCSAHFSSSYSRMTMWPHTASTPSSNFAEVKYKRSQDGGYTSITINRRTVETLASGFWLFTSLSWTQIKLNTKTASLSPLKTDVTQDGPNDVLVPADAYAFILPPPQFCFKKYGVLLEQMKPLQGQNEALSEQITAESKWADSKH